MTRRVLPLLAVALALPVAACGDESSGKPATTASSTRAADAQGTPLTNEQAQLLASAQFLNYRNDGAEFTMDFGVEGAGLLRLEGQMDWDQLIGYATVTPEDASSFEVWWRQDIVVQSAPDLSAVLRAADQPPVFISHKPNPLANPVDKAIAIMLELGSKKRDNPLLVKQKAGSAYLGDDTVRGTPTLILRYGAINRFWVDPETGLMLRFGGNSKAKKAPVTVELLTHEAQTIYAPQGRIVSVRQARQIATQFGLPA